MTHYEVVETDDGLSVVEIEPGVTPEEAARRHGGILIDPGPYDGYEDAYDALAALKRDEGENAR
jgi:hypothetical protein